MSRRLLLKVGRLVSAKLLRLPPEALSAGHVDRLAMETKRVS